MSYSTNTTIVLLLPGMPQTSSSKNYSATVAVIDQHIARADNIVNGKIVARYDISSFDTAGSVPPILRTLSEDITSAYSYRSFYSADNQNNSDYLDKFNEAMETLNEIRDGDLFLFDTSGSLIEERVSTTDDGALVTSNTEDYTSTFDEGPVLGWLVDPDKIDAIEDEKM